MRDPLRPPVSEIQKHLLACTRDVVRVERKLVGLYHQALRELSAQLIRKALAEHHGNILRAAAHLGIERSYVYTLCLRYGVRLREFRLKP